MMLPLRALAAGALGAGLGVAAGLVLGEPRSWSLPVIAAVAAVVPVLSWDAAELSAGMVLDMDPGSKGRKSWCEVDSRTSVC